MSLGRDISAGLLSGLSASVVALSSGALLFGQSHPHAQGVAMAMMLVTAVVGSLYGSVSRDSAVAASVEPGVVSVIAAALALHETQNEGLMTHEVILMLGLISVMTGLALGFMARFRWGHLARYLPFPVIAGFMASTGWLIASGALDIAAGLPLNQRGFERLWVHPWHPELLVTLLGATLLMIFVRRDRRGWVIPAVLVGMALFIHGLLSSGLCQSAVCAPQNWLFSSVGSVHWLPPPLLDISALYQLDGLKVLSLFPVVFLLVVMNILINFASLEMTFGGEYDLEEELNHHARGSVVSALLGGFIPVISVSRTTLHKVFQAGRYSGWVASLFALALLIGASSFIGFVPRAVLAAVTLYLGLHLMEEWLWKQYRRLSLLDFLQILVMTVLVALLGFIPGFVLGLVMACLMFVKTYSETPLYIRMGNLQNHMSSVVRSDTHAEYLLEQGDRVRIYRLQGYLFFGSFHRFDEQLAKTDIAALETVIVDFARVTGVDSAAQSVLKRIFRRYQSLPCKWICVYNPATRKILEDLAQSPEISDQVFFVPNLDLALEMAEEQVLSRFPSAPIPVEQACFGWLQDPMLIERFMSYCHIKKIEKGEELCLEGDTPTEIFFLGAGSLEVVKRTAEGEVRLAKVNRGAMVGETAFFSGVPRVATVRAASEAQVFYLTADDFERMRGDRPKLGNRFDHYLIRKLSKSQVRNDTRAAEWITE